MRAGMRHDAIAVEQALAAAMGDDRALVAELRAAFTESAVRHAMMLAGAASRAEWREAAWRLKGCAASFGAEALMAAADAAAAGPVRSAAALNAVAAALDELAAA